VHCYLVFWQPVSLPSIPHPVYEYRGHAPPSQHTTPCVHSHLTSLSFFFLRDDLVQKAPLLFARAFHKGSSNSSPLLLSKLDRARPCLPSRANSSAPLRHDRGLLLPRELSHLCTIAGGEFNTWDPRFLIPSFSSCHQKFRSSECSRLATNGLFDG